MKRFLTVFIAITAIAAVAAFAAPHARADVQEVYITPHFHYDPVFEKDQHGCTLMGLDRTRRFLMCLKDDPTYAAVFSEIDYLKPYFDAYPEDRQLLLRFISENRAETGGSYNEPNEMSIGGEGIIRNILYGRAYHEGVLGDKRALVYQPFDVFGHTPQITQILAKSRFKGIVWRKGNPETEKYVGITVPGLTPDFWGLAPDGSMLHHRREHYKAISGTSSEQDLIAKINDKKKTQDKLGLPAEFGLLSSADFAYPETWLAGHTANLRKNNPPVIISGPSAYFERMAKAAPKPGNLFPVISRDFSLYHAGTALTRQDLKIANRLAENTLYSAELLSVAASLSGAPYPEEKLDLAWRQLLFNQHHDGITGSCCDRCYFDLMAGYREAVEAGGLALSGAASALSNSIAGAAANKKSGNVFPLAVFNTLGWKRTDVARAYPADLGMRLPPYGAVKLMDAAGKSVPFDYIKGGIEFVAKDIPAAGYKVFFLETDKTNAANDDKRSGANAIENEYYKLAVDPARGGGIVELIDKKTGRVVIGPETKYPGNELIVLKEDAGPQYIAWELSTKGVAAMSSQTTAKVNAVKGRAFTKLIIEGELSGFGGYKQEITLHSGIKRIDFLTTVINPAGTDKKDDRDMWVVRFPAKLNGTGPVISDRFYAVGRRRSLKPLEYRTDLSKMLTLSAPYAADKWAEEGHAVRIDVVDAKGAIKDARQIALCEIVHPRDADSTAAARALQLALVIRGITCTPSFDDEDRNTDLLNRNTRFVIDIAGGNKFAASLKKDNDAWKAYSARLAKDGAAKLFVTARANGLDIRSVETLVLGARDAESMNKMIAALSGEITEKTRIVLKEEENARAGKPSGAPDSYGIALLNRGTLLHSFDNNGTIVMGLFHFAPWARENIPVDAAGEMRQIPFALPNEKAHCYEYALYPHDGDWRSAKTYRVAAEFNTPLIVDINRQGFAAPPKLAASGSYFDITSGSSVLTAVKAAGNKYASMKTGASAGPANGVVMRFHEAEGKKDAIRIKFFKPVKAAWRANLVEEKDISKPVKVESGNTISFAIGPNAIETIFVEFANAKNAPEADEKTIDAKGRPPVFSNYWELNAGAAYAKNSPVSVTLDFPLEKKLPDPVMLRAAAAKPRALKTSGSAKLRLTVSNNSMDSRLKDVVKLTAPAGWKFTPDSVAVDYAPLESKAIEVQLEASGGTEIGYVRAEMEGQSGYKMFDVLPFGKHPELDAEVAVNHPGLRQSTDKLIIVRIRNNQGGRIDGWAMPIGSLETWPREIAGDVALMPVSPRAAPLSLEDGEETELKFTAGDAQTMSGQQWLMIKIAYNGDLKYIPVIVK